MTPRPLRLLRNLSRGREIAAVLLNHGFGDVVQRLGMRRWMFWRRETPPPLTVAVRLRLVCEALGPTFIKFGQVVSTRPDLLPRDIITELARLREHVPAFPSDQAMVMVEEAIGGPISELFLEFEPVPVAAGSLGQVHRAWLQDGTPLAIKVRRPTVLVEVERDLGLMFDLAHLVERRIPETRIFDPVGLVRHFAHTIRRELNFSREARTMAEFSRSFAPEEGLVVPDVFAEYSNDGVLVMRYVAGISVDALSEIAAAGVLPSHVAANGARAFLKQAFEIGLFHGDPHPGNLRVLPDGRICLYDFGMIGLLDEPTRDRLIDLFAAIGRRDHRKACKVLMSLSDPFGPVDESLLAAEVRDFVNSYYGIPLEKVRVGQLLADFLGILSSHKLRCPADLMLLVRATVTLEGTGRQLDPHFNLAEHLAPFIERMIRQRYEPARIAARAAKETGELFERARRLPYRVDEMLERLNRDDLRVRLDVEGLERLTNELDRSSNRLAIGLVMAALVVASALLIRSVPDSHWFAVPIFLLSSLLGLWLIYGIVRSGSV